MVSFSKLCYTPKHYFATDKIIAIIILVSTILFIVWLISIGRYRILMPIIPFVSSLIYLLFRKKISAEENIPVFPEAKRIRLITHIVFIISASLLIWLSWSNLYYRPPLYFALVLVASASIIIDIFCLNELKNSHITIALFKILVLSFVIYAGIYYQFPGIYGMDPWWHNEKIQEIIINGNLTISGFSSYYLFPVFHLVGALAKIITSLSVYDSVFATSGFFMAVCSLFVFLVGREVINSKAGLLAALIVPLTANNIERATELIPMSLGYFFFLAILYLVFRGDKKRANDSLLIIFLSLTVILTHTLAALATLLSIIGIFIVININKYKNKHIRNYSTVSLTLVIFFSVAMLTRWMQNVSDSSSSLFSSMFGRFAKSLNIDAQFTLASPPTAPTANDISYGIALLDQGGYLLLLAFAIIGVLIFLYPKNYTHKRKALVFVPVVFLVVIYGFSLFNLAMVLPDRWFIFLYAPLSILAVAGSLGVSHLIRRKTMKLSMVMLVLLAVIFTMTTNSIANNDSPLVFNGASRVGYTQSEFTAIKTLSGMRSDRPITDLYYGEIFHYVIEKYKPDEKAQVDNKIFIKRNYYLYNPDWDQKFQVTSYNSGIVRISDIFKKYEIDKESLVYNNGNVKAYVISRLDKRI